MKSSNMQLLGFMSVPSGCIFATMESKHSATFVRHQAFFKRDLKWTLTIHDKKLVHNLHSLHP